MHRRSSRNCATRPIGVPRTWHRRRAATQPGRPRNRRRGRKRHPSPRTLWRPRGFGLRREQAGRRTRARYAGNQLRRPARRSRTTRGRRRSPRTVGPWSTIRNAPRARSLRHRSTHDGRPTSGPLVGTCVCPNESLEKGRYGDQDTPPWRHIVSHSDPMRESSDAFGRGRRLSAASHRLKLKRFGAARRAGTGDRIGCSNHDATTGISIGLLSNEESPSYRPRLHQSERAQPSPRYETTG